MSAFEVKPVLFYLVAKPQLGNVVDIDKVTKLGLGNQDPD